MSTLFNSQQNININISYNLAAQKKTNTKPTGKKINKTTKINATHVHSNISQNVSQNKKLSNVQSKHKKRSDTYPDTMLDANDIQQYVKIFKPKKKIPKNMHLNDNKDTNQHLRRFKTQAFATDDVVFHKSRPQTTSHKKQTSVQFFSSKPSNSLKSNHKHHKSNQNQFAKKQRSSNLFMNSSNLNPNQQNLINIMKNNPKNSKKSHNKSCMLYSLKKGLIDQNNHIISTKINNQLANSSNFGQIKNQKIQKRRRIKSQCSIVRKKQNLVDRFLNMNMSLLGSQFGGSQVVNMGEINRENQRARQQNYQKILKQFMSSLDIHIMKNMEHDKAIAKKLNFFEEQNSTRLKQMNILSDYQVKDNLIDFQKKVLNQYKPMFKNALQKKKLFQFDTNNQDHFQQDDFIQIQQVKFNLKSDNLKAQKCSPSPIRNNFLEENGSDSFDQIFDDHVETQSQFKQIKYKIKQKDQPSRSLNIDKYRQLVSQKKKEKQQKQKYESQQREKLQQYFNKLQRNSGSNDDSNNSDMEQFQFYENPKSTKLSKQNHQTMSNHQKQRLNEHWNETNRLLTQNMRNNIDFDQNKVYQELQKQSKLINKWMEQDLQQQPQKDSIQQLQQDVSITQNNKQSSSFQQSVNKGKTIEIPPPTSALKDDQLDDFEQYNCKKYTNQVNQNIQINQPFVNNEDQQKNQQNSPIGQESWDKQWFQDQIVKLEKKHGIGMMKNYLDCGLDGFGLKVNTHQDQIEQKQFQQSQSKKDIDNQYKNSKASINQFLQKQKFNSEEQLISQEQNNQDYQLTTKFQDQRKQFSKIGKQPSYFPYTNSLQDDQQSLEDEQNENQQNNNKINLVTQFIIQDLMNKLSSDIAAILEKSSRRSFIGSNRNSQNSSRNNSEVSSASQSVAIRPKKGIQTGFNAVKQYLMKLKQFILNYADINSNYKAKVLQNLNRVIGPSSIQILSYLRITDQSQFDEYYDFGNQEQQDQDHLYVVPTNAFNQFQNKIANEIPEADKAHQERMKTYKNFFHRAIFEAYNQCLDYQKPYGIAGRPYQWATQTRMYRTVKQIKFEECLDNAIGRLLQSNTQLSGLIFDKEQSPFYSAMIQQQYKQQINQQRLSRMLANQLFQTQQTWINYNDEIAQLLVQLSRIIEQKVIIQICIDLKKVSKRRKILMFHNKKNQIQQVKQIQIE